MRAARIPLLATQLLLLGSLALWAPSGAHAASSAYGEITRFGESGSGAGQINGEERRATEEQRSHLIGVDPGDNSVYVLDEPHEYEQNRKKPSKEEQEECEEEEIPLSECGEPVGPVKRHFRLQKFTASGGSYHGAASAQFEEEAPNGPQGPSRLAVEGIAVDAARHRVYVLAVDVRQQKAKVDKEARNGPGRGGNLPVASTLYAFSTEEKGGALAPAGKAGKNKEILTGSGAGELEAQSETPGKALLEPGGITVDPETGDVILVGHEDPSGEEADEVFDSRSRERTSPDHYMLQRISPSGELVPGEAGRYVDQGNFFKATEFSEFKPPAPNSPVVVGPEHSEQVELTYERAIVAVPDDFSSHTEPRYMFRPSSESAVAEARIGQSQLGGALSASPFEGGGNTLYAPTIIESEQPKLSGTPKGVAAFSGPGPSLLGWSGGQSLLAPRGKEEEREECVLEPGGNEMFAPVAAGSGGEVFVLAEEFVAEVEGERTYEGPPFPAVVELGPGGKGCPQAIGRGLAGEVDGELLGGRPVTMSEPVTFSSYVNQADALKVEWEFGDGTGETNSSTFNCRPGVVPEEDREFERNVRQCPTTQHTFVRPGTLTVTERIYTDDLATPTVTQQTTVNVVGALGPRAVATGPLEVARGQEALFDGSASSDPAGANQIRSYHWDFGDGQQATTGSPTITHVYSNLGAYTVSLEVTDAGGATSPPATLPRPVAVVEPRSPGGVIEGQLQSGASAPSGGGVAGYTAASTGSGAIPDVTLASAAFTATSAGTIPVLLYCPLGESSCAGTITLRGLLTGAGHKAKHPTMATLARGSFAFAGGIRKRILLRLSLQARVQLARTHKLLAQVTILAHDPAGAVHTTRLSVLLRTPAAAKGKAKH